MSIRASWILFVSIAAPALAADPVALVRERQGKLEVTRPAQVRDGQLLVIEVQSQGRCKAPKVRWANKTYPTHEVGARHHALLPVKLGLAPGEQPLEVRCGGEVARLSVPIEEGVHPESRLTVDPKFSSKPPPRAAAESRAIREAWTRGRKGRSWAESFVRPADGIQTSPFGVRRTYNGKLASRHQGLDLDGRVGDPVRAANAGVVVLAAEDFYYTGNAVFIDHGDGLFTTYFHLSRLDVKTGDRVTRGQQIGLMGATGRVTGPHLHFGVKLAGTYVDPVDLLGYEPRELGVEAVAAAEEKSEPAVTDR